jgi:hypothetical protein
MGGARRYILLHRTSVCSRDGGIASCCQVFSAKVHSFGREVARNALARAFAISILVHFVGISGVELGSRLGWWRVSILPSRKSRVVDEVVKAEQLLQEQIRQALQQTPEAQLVFVEVDPAAAVPEPPKDAKYYSSQSTIASNPNIAEKEQPKIDGQQEKVSKTFDTMKPAPQPVQPTPPPPKNQPKTQPSEQKQSPQRPPLLEEPKPTREQQPGETLLARAAPKVQPQPPPEEKRRPRTVAEAKAQKGVIEGTKSRQEGGVRKHSLGTSLDVKSTPFGAYDALFIQAVQARWFNLLDERNYLGNQAGKVVVEFRLNYDGRITSLRVVESEVNEIMSWLCQCAILDPAPYRPFPSDLRRMLSHDYREVRFTFYYNQ